MTGTSNSHSCNLKLVTDTTASASVRWTGQCKKLLAIGAGVVFSFVLLATYRSAWDVKWRRSTSSRQVNDADASLSVAVHRVSVHGGHRTTRGDLARVDSQLGVHWIRKVADLQNRTSANRSSWERLLPSPVRIMDAFNGAVYSLDTDVSIAEILAGTKEQNSTSTSTVPSKIAERKNGARKSATSMWMDHRWISWEKRLPCVTPRPSATWVAAVAMALLVLLIAWYAWHRS